jgi:uncharacterized protein YfaP (DUF2135 family)
MNTSQQTGAIFGTVRDAANNTVADAAVMVIGGSAPHHDIAALTGPDGRFELPSLPEGSYSIQATTSNGTATGRAEVRPGSRTRLDLRIL